MENTNKNGLILGATNPAVIMCGNCGMRQAEKGKGLCPPCSQPLPIADREDLWAWPILVAAAILIIVLIVWLAFRHG